VFGVCESEELVAAGLSLLPLSPEFVIVFAVLSTFPYFANAEPAKPLTAISDEAIAMVKRAAIIVVLFESIMMSDDMLCFKKYEKK
jgi:hypothetical protein